MTGFIINLFTGGELGKFCHLQSAICVALLGTLLPCISPTLTPMLLISDPRTGRSDDEDSDLVFDSFTLSAI